MNRIVIAIAIAIAIAIILLLVSSCQKTDGPKYISLFTKDVTLVNDSTALFSAEIDNPSKILITETGFVWGMESSTRNFKVFDSTKLTRDFALYSNKSLLPGKSYYVRAYIKTEDLEITGENSTFKTNGKIQIGSWTEVFHDNSTNGFCKYILSSFSINNYTFLIFQDGSLYRYSHSLNKFDFVISDAILGSSSFCAVYQGSVYIFSLNCFYRFNYENLSFIKLARWPSSDAAITGFLINDDIYVGLANYNNAFWKYNISTDYWERISDFPGEKRSGAFGLSVNGLGYVGGGIDLTPSMWQYPIYESCWQYNPDSDSWIEIAEVPINNEEVHELQCLNMNDNLYSYYKKGLRRYDTTYNYWEAMASLNINNNLCTPYLFSYNDQIFVIDVREYDGNHYNMWSYAK